MEMRGNYPPLPSVTHLLVRFLFLPRQHRRPLRRHASRTALLAPQAQANNRHRAKQSSSLFLFPQLLLACSLHLPAKQSNLPSPPSCRQESPRGGSKQSISPRFGSMADQDAGEAAAAAWPPWTSLLLRALSRRQTWVALFLAVYAALLCSSWTVLVSVCAWYYSSASSALPVGGDAVRFGDVRCRARDALHALTCGPHQRGHNRPFTTTSNVFGVGASQSPKHVMSSKFFKRLWSGADGVGAIFVR